MQDKPITPTDAREEYEPPAVVSEDVFETRAMTCTKISGGACDPEEGGTQQS